MSKIAWDETGDKTYETGTDRGVLYRRNAQGAYDKGYAWNGLTAVTQAPSGAEATAVYADNIKYLSMQSAEEFGCTIEAFSSPVEFDACDGSATPRPGINVGQQRRETFGFSYRSLLGNDIDGNDYGYKIHLIYGGLAAPSERAHATVNDSPEPMPLSWEVTTTPVPAGAGLKPTAILTINSTLADPEALAALEKLLYGDDTAPAVVPQLPLPSVVIEMFPDALGG